MQRNRELLTERIMHLVMATLTPPRRRLRRIQCAARPRTIDKAPREFTEEPSGFFYGPSARGETLPAALERVNDRKIRLGVRPT